MALKPKKKAATKKMAKPKKRAPAAAALPEPEGVSPVPAAPVSESADSGRKKMLITDDDPALTHVLELKFRGAGFDVTVCHNGQEAIDAMNREKFDGMILDLIMPVKTGFDVLQEKFSTKNKDTPVFVMSDMRTPETEEQVRSLGATDFMVKMQMPLKEVIDIISRAA